MPSRMSSICCRSHPSGRMLPRGSSIYFLGWSGGRFCREDVTCFSAGFPQEVARTTNSKRNILVFMAQSICVQLVRAQVSFSNRSVTSVFLEVLDLNYQAVISFSATGRFSWIDFFAASPMAMEANPSDPSTGMAFPVSRASINSLISRL